MSWGVPSESKDDTPLWLTLGEDEQPVYRSLGVSFDEETHRSIGNIFDNEFDGPSGLAMPSLSNAASQSHYAAPAKAGLQLGNKQLEANLAEGIDALPPVPVFIEPFS